MRLLLISAFALIAGVTLNAADLTGTDLAGTWKGSMGTQAGQTEVTITIKPGAGVTGTIQAGEYEAPIQNVRISGDRISFEMKIGFGTVYYEGAAVGEEMRFDVMGTQGDKYTLTCTRQSGRK